MNYNVFNYKSKTKLGTFLNIETVNCEVKIWYLSNDGNIEYRYREDVYLKEDEDFGN